MSEFDNTNRGVLFPQDAETDRHPNLTGKIDVNGTEYRLAAWKRESKGGKKYLSLTVSEAQVPAGVSSKSDEISDF